MPKDRKLKKDISEKLAYKIEEFRKVTAEAGSYPNFVTDCMDNMPISEFFEAIVLNNIELTVKWKGPIK